MVVRDPFHVRQLSADVAVELLRRSTLLTDVDCEPAELPLSALHQRSESQNQLGMAEQRELWCLQGSDAPKGIGGQFSDYIIVTT